MLELHNETPWAAGLYPGWDRQRRFQLTAVFKCAWRFDTDGNLEPLEEVPPLVECDEHHGKPHETSLRAADETVPFKHGGEVLLTGTAHPAGEGDPFTTVRLAIDFPDGRAFRKELYVFGRRHWQRRLLSHVPGEPAPLEPTPLRYEYAFGGRVPGKPGSEYPLNPVGLGYNPSDWKLINAELPRLEIPSRLIGKPTHKPVPAGFGPLPVFWQPRADEIGEALDEPEMHGGCPWPETAEPVLHNAAPPDQRFDRPFTGGEVIRLAGFFPDRHPSQEVVLTIPAPAVRIVTRIEGAVETCQPVIDTLLIDTDAFTIQLVGRAGIPWQRLDTRRGWVVIRDDTAGSRMDEPENDASAGAQRLAGGAS